MSAAQALPPWPVLVVDDDRGVLDVTRMALERVQVDGRKLSLALCSSADEARQKLSSHEYAVAIVDVVMESDRAGLDLVREMRGDRRHRLTQIVVRTGEPGAYPEAKVIEDFHISDYWPKAELRAARMRASIIGLVRGYVTARSLDAELREKDTLLREIHHRVKNNLQILSSLLALQGQEVDERTRQKLEQTAGRVRSMALVHQHLYSHDSLASIDFAAYLEALARDVAAAVGHRAEIRFEGDAVHLSVDGAIPAGLILNELLTNAVQHGRSEDGVARVDVSLTSEPHRVVVHVRDRGTGMPSAPSGRGLGWHLVQALTRQIRATLRQQDDEGLHVTLEIPHETPTR
jgi:two-component sensor histidine kinase